MIWVLYEVDGLQTVMERVEAGRQEVVRAVQVNCDDDHDLDGGSGVFWCSLRRMQSRTFSISSMIKDTTAPPEHGIEDWRR